MPDLTPTQLDSLADVADRMAIRFGGRIARPTIVRVVRHCRRELSIAHGSVPMEAVEHLATRRLGGLADTGHPVR